MAKGSPSTLIGKANFICTALLSKWSDLSSVMSANKYSALFSSVMAGKLLIICHFEYAGAFAPIFHSDPYGSDAYYLQFYTVVHTML